MDRFAVKYQRATRNCWALRLDDRVVFGRPQRHCHDHRGLARSGQPGAFERRELLLGFLLIEAAANVGGLLTLISSVPAIIVGTAANISSSLFVVAAPYVVVAAAITIYIGSRQFKINALSTQDERDEAVRSIAEFDETDGIESPRFFRFSAVMTGLFIIVIAMTSVLPWVKELGMSFVALSFAVIMLIRYKSEVDRFYRAVDWDLLGFFAALFVVINVMEHARVLALIGHGLQWIIGLGQTTGSALCLQAPRARLGDRQHSTCSDAC